jgi:hypothetical protein
MLILIYFLPKGLGGNQYNSWNVANGSELIDPVTRQVREGVTKYTPEMGRLCFSSFSAF